MAIFTALVTATKVLASQGAKKAAVSAAKGVVKKKAKNFITGKGKKKKVSAIEKRSRGRGGYSSKPGAIVKSESSGVTPFVEGVSKSSDTSSKQETKTESGSFESIAKQLTGIVTLTNTLDGILKSQYKTQKENTKQERIAAEKEKKREREEEKESKGSGIMSGIGGAIGAAGQKSGIFNYLTNILLGSAALGLFNNIGKLTSAFEFLKDNWSEVIGGIKMFALTFVNAKPAIIKAFSKIKQFTGKGLSAVKSGFSKVGKSFVNLFRKLGVFVPKYIKDSITRANKGIRAAVEGGRRLPQAFKSFLTFDTRSDKLGASKGGLDKLGSGRGGTGSGAGRGIGEGFKRLSGSSSGKMARTLDFDVDQIRKEYGNEAARQYQNDIEVNKVKPKRALANIKKNIKAGKLTKAPMTGSVSKGIGGSQLVKGGIKRTSKRALIKFVGKGGAKAVLGTLRRIPIIGPLIVGVASFLETGKIDQALFRAGGALIGGFLGTFIPIPVIGTMMGELIGEYVGDLFYTLIRGGGVEAVGQKLQDDLKSLLSTGQKVAQWVGSGLQRFYEGVPKWKIGIPWIGGEFEVPDMVWWVNPFNIGDKAKIFGEAFFSEKPIQDGNVKEEKKQDSDFQDRLNTAQTLEGMDTSQYTPEFGALLEANKEQNIKDGLVIPGLKDVYGNPLTPSAPTSSADNKPVPKAAQTPMTGPIKPGGSIEVIGDGGGATGKLIFKDASGRRVGKVYEAISGVFSTAGTSQDQRRNVSGALYPMPDGSFPLLDFQKHGFLPGIGEWSTYINNPSGSIGSRSQLLVHNDIGSNGTAGCIGVELGGRSGTEQEKEFLKMYNMVQPKTLKVSLASKGSVPPLTPPKKSPDNAPVKEVKPKEDKIPGITPPQKKDDSFVLKDANGNPLSDIGKSKTPASEVTPTETAVPGSGKPMTVPTDQIPGSNASQAEKDEYIRKLEAGELTGGNSTSEVSPPAPVLPPPPPQMTPQSSPSVSGIETYDEPQQGSTAVIPIPQQSAPSGGGGGGGGSTPIPGPSVGSLLNSYYKQQLLGFLYKQG